MSEVEYGYKINRLGERVRDGDEFGTPIYLLDAAREVAGVERFELDPFSSDWHNARVHAERFFSRDYSALGRSWMRQISDQFGYVLYRPVVSVWANPPYSQPLLEQCVSRWVSAVENGECLHAFLLAPATPATKWAQHVLEWPHCLLERRVSHHHPSVSSEETINGTRHDSMIVYAGPMMPRFRRVFGELGIVR